MLELRRGERAGERRVDVAGHDDEIGPSSTKTCSSALERACVCSPCEPEPTSSVVWPRQRQLREEDIAHRAVVVLARVDEPLLDALALARARVDRRDLHVVRPRADDVNDERARSHDDASAFRSFLPAR